MFLSYGTLQYSLSETYKLWLLVDDDIGNYYRSLIPLKINKPKYPTHISVFRGKDVPLLNKWNLHHGKVIEFYYDGIIYNNEVYWWLEAKCPTLELIRIELGLSPTDEITSSPDRRHNWHITIANNK